MPDDCLPILVAAYGNEMAADDSFGPRVAEAVRAMALAGVEVVSLGMQAGGAVRVIWPVAAPCAWSTPPAATACPRGRSSTWTSGTPTGRVCSTMPR